MLAALGLAGHGVFMTSAARDDLDFKRVDVPRVDSPWWAGAAAPLLAYFGGGGRTIDEVVEWGREQGLSGSMVRHMLAWLSFRGLVYHDDVSASWRAVTWMSDGRVGLSRWEHRS